MRRNLLRLIAVFTLGCLAFPSVLRAAPEGTSISFSSEETAAIYKALDEQWRTVHPKPKSKTTFRLLFVMFLNALGTDWHPERLPYLLDLAAEMQDRNPKSKSCGNFRWEWDHPEPYDRNAVEFASQRAALALELYGAKISPEVKEKLNEILGFAIPAILRHHVDVSYTNVFVIKSWNLIALGETVGRPELADEGYRMLDEWTRYTWENGIHEYNSPSYILGYINPLAHIAFLANRAEGRANAEAGVRFGWSEVAANWFPPGERLGGAHARDYRYLSGAGVVTKLVRAAGWLASGPDDPSSDIGGVYWKAAQSKAGGSHAPSKDQPVPRFVYQRWGNGPGQYAAHYVGKNFSLGSAGACYGTTDKPLTMTWPGGADLPMMNFLMDGRGDPYGVRAFDAGGHQKALHLVPFLTSVQRGSQALLMASVDLGHTTVKYGDDLIRELGSHLVLPQMDQWWIGERELTGLTGLREGASVPLQPGESLFARRGDVMLGVRVLLATYGNETSPVALEFDADGMKNNACRLTAQHATTKPDKRGTIVLWVQAAENLDEKGRSAFRQAFLSTSAWAEEKGGVVNASVRSTPQPLHLTANVLKGQRLVVEGGEDVAKDVLISVNGRDIGRDALRAAPALQKQPLPAQNP